MQKSAHAEGVRSWKTEVLALAKLFGHEMEIELQHLVNALCVHVMIDNDFIRAAELFDKIDDTISAAFQTKKG